MTRAVGRLALAWATAVAAAGGAVAQEGAPEEGAPREVNLYIWSEYIDPEIVSAFQVQTGLQVNLSLYESSEEMLAKIQYAGGEAEYDVVVVANTMVPPMARLGLLQPLDHGRIPNLQNLDAAFAGPSYDPGNRYSVAYQWGTVGLMYNRGRHPDLEPTWAVLFDPARQVGPFALIDEVRDQLGVALIYLGYSPNAIDPEAVKAAGQLVLTAKKSRNAKGFEGGVGGKNRVAAGLVDLAVVWNGDALRAIDEAEEMDLAYAIPKEGSILWADVMAIPSQAPNAAGAHRFIDYILDADVGAQLSNFNRYATPNRAALAGIDSTDQGNPVLYPPAPVMQRLQYQQDVGEHTRLYDEVWTAVKAR